MTPTMTPGLLNVTGSPCARRASVVVVADDLGIAESGVGDSDRAVTDAAAVFDVVAVAVTTVVADAVVDAELINVTLDV